MEIGVIGIGKMGLVHAGILNSLKDCRVTAICEPNSRIRNLASAFLPNVLFFKNAREMIQNTDLSGVYVTTPIASHLAVVEELIGGPKGIGLFVEKPLAHDASSAERIVQLASKGGFKGMVGFQKRYQLQFSMVKKLLESKALGALVSFTSHAYVSSVFGKSKTWRFERRQGGALLDVGSHLMDLLLWYFGSPTSVRATEVSIFSRDVEDSASVELLYPGGMNGRAEVSWSINGFRLLETRVDITGSKGKLSVGDDLLEVDIHESSPGSPVRHEVLRKPDFSPGVEFYLGESEYCREDTHFLRCLREDTVPHPTLYEGLGVNLLIDRVHESATRGTRGA